MGQSIEKLITQLIDLHRAHVEVWRSRLDEVNKLAQGFANHIQQKRLFDKVSLQNTDLGLKCPHIKRQLMQKLDQKIQSYVVKLGEQSALMAQQRHQICDQSDKCKAAIEAYSLDQLIAWRQAQVSTAYLIELCYCLDLVYVEVHRTMLHYVECQAATTHFFPFSDFESILEKTWLA